MQGGEDEVIQALSRGDLASAPLDDRERGLMKWIELLTLTSHRNSLEDVDRLRHAGWNDDQIAEAAYIAALFAFFNRVADAFGLEDWKN